MIQIVFDIVTIVLLGCVSGAALLFHHRLTTLRVAIGEAGQVLPKLDMAVTQMNEAATGFSGRIHSEIQAVDIRLASAKRMTRDLETCVRNAEEMNAKLEQRIRQARKLDQARAAAVPREQAEPKGFAEHLERLAAVHLPDAAESGPGSLHHDDTPDDIRALQAIAAYAPPTPSRSAFPHGSSHTPSDPFTHHPPAPHPAPHGEDHPERLSLLALAPFNSFAGGRAG